MQPGRGRLLEADVRLAGAAASMLQDDRVLAVPTDTLYGKCLSIFFITLLDPLT